MARSSAVAAQWENVGELLEQLGNIAPGRVRLDPRPGTATVRDLIRVNEQADRLYELVDGTLVEKVMGYPQSTVAGDLVFLLKSYLVGRDLGNVTPGDGGLRLLGKLVRLPDVSFVRWERLPNRQVPREPIPNVAPNLAVEVLSKGNTKEEMERKLKEYFLADVELVWFVDLKRRTVEVFTAPDVSQTYHEGQALDGGDVLPGLFLPVEQIFVHVPREEKGAAKKAPRRKDEGPPRKRRP